MTHFGEDPRGIPWQYTTVFGELVNRKNCPDLNNNSFHLDYEYYIKGMDTEIKHGEYIMSCVHTGQIIKHCFYKYGKLHGEYKEWYINGTLHYHHFYIDEMPIGEYRSWSPSGNILSHGFYVNNDKYIIYHFRENGQLASVQLHFFGGFRDFFLPKIKHQYTNRMQAIEL